MATRRRVSPELMRAFESAQVEPFDFETPGRVVEVPVPAEQFNPNDSAETAPIVRPKSRFDVVREYLETTRQPMPQPTTPEVDMQGAADFDARRNLGRSFLAAGQAFTGNRRAMPQVTNAAETQALAEREARKRELEQWAAGRETARTREAGLLGQALTADEATRQREAQAGLQRERLGFDKEKEATSAEDKDLDRAAKAEAEAARLAAKKGAGGKSGGKVFKDASALRKEFNGLQEVKMFKEASTSFDKIQRAAATPSAAGDLSLIFAYMKVLDPGSTVREGEFAAAAAAAGADQRLLGALEKVRSGQKLTPDQRADFVARAKDLYAAQRQQYDTQATLYRRLAEKQGADPDDIVGAGGQKAEEEKPPQGKVPMVSESTGATVFLSPAAAAAMEKAGKVKKP